MDTYGEQRAKAAKWLHDRKDRVIWWRWSVLTAKNNDPESMKLSETVAFNIFIDLFRRGLLVPMVADDGLDAYALDLGKEEWKTATHLPTFADRFIWPPLKWIFVSWGRCLVWLASIVISAYVGSLFK
ncbi:MAG: hypothetical protein ACLQNE_19950 [Thermoguttaceae bacterium]